MRCVNLLLTLTSGVEDRAPVGLTEGLWNFPREVDDLL